MLLNLARVKGLALRINTGSHHVGALVHVGKEQGRADTRLGMKPRATVAMPASSDLKVEGAVNPVLLRPEYRR